MSLNGSLFNGISGINVNSQAMTVIGNNIANVNTTGFKASRLSFEDILNQSLTGSSIAMKAGRGVTVNAITPLFTQGSLESTSSPTDMAIDGSGFFIIGDGKNNFYTRAGNFTLNEDGSLVNPAGLSVQGWKADPSGKINTSSTLSNINVSGIASAPLATDQITLGLNLDSASKNGDNYSSSLIVYDSKGQEITLTANYTQENVPSTELATDQVFLNANLDSAAKDTDEFASSLEVYDSLGEPLTLTQNFIFEADAKTIGNNIIPANHWTWSVDPSEGTVSADSNGYITFNQNGQIDKLYDSNGNILTANPTIEITELGDGATIGQQGMITWNIIGSLINKNPLSVTISTNQNGGGNDVPENRWKWEISSNVGTVSSDSSGYLTFSQNGQLDKIYDSNKNILNSNPSIMLTNLPNGATIGNQGKITLNVVDEYGKSNGSLTGYASPSVTTSMQQNGYSTGALQSLSIDKSGEITGLFTNGQLQKIGQIAMADFVSPWGLNPIGNNLFSETVGSGQPMIGVAGTAGKGEIKANSLEQSNVDLASEFVKMITTQRGFQANSRVITTTDAMLEEIVNLKR